MTCKLLNQTLKLGPKGDPLSITTHSPQTLNLHYVSSKLNSQCMKFVLVCYF